MWTTCYDIVDNGNVTWHIHHIIEKWKLDAQLKNLITYDFTGYTLNCQMCSDSLYVMFIWD